MATMKYCRKSKCMKEMHVFYDFIAARLGLLTSYIVHKGNCCRSGTKKHKLCKCWTL